LGLVDANPYEVVLSDIDMPGIDGVQLLREIRGRDLDVPVLLITGHPRVDTAVEALETRFNHALETLRLVFQPIVRAVDGTVFGYEALARTEEPSIPNPGALFEAAERLGRVHEVGGVVRDRAASFLTRVPSLTLFVNVHAQELTDDALLSP